MTSSISRRAGPLFGVVLVVGGLLASFTPSVPAVRALDPTPGPSPTEPAPTAEPTPEPTEAPSVDPSGPPPSATPAPSATPEPTLKPGGLGVTHSWVNTVDETGQVTVQGELDTPVADAMRFTVYRVRFQLVNDGDEAMTLEPALQLKDDGWSAIPEVNPRAGKAFYAASDDGRAFKERRTRIPAARLRLDKAGDATPVEGLSSAGENPMSAVKLPAHSYTEVEFAIRATMDAAWTEGYDLRLVSDGRELAGATRVRITMGEKPDVELSPGQKNGRGVKDPVPLYALDPTIGWTDMPTPTALGTGHTASYALRGPIAAPGPYTTPHTNYTLATDACASCHSSHTARSALLLRESAPQATLCFSCHDGSGALSDVKSDWTSPSLPANNAATSSWYSHPSTDASAADHVSDKENEFGDALERHAACADCHQPHLADATRPVNSVAGWTASGALKGASGVSVVNGAAGTAPTYSLKTTSAFEYELCLKCHSGFTQLPAQDPARPSRWALDKGVELNPANVSYHPVEAAGKNQTNAMALSLAGTSPYKLWNFETDETVRCLNCHGDSDMANPASPPTADSRLDNHAGPNRGMLIANYKDRVLKPQGQLYLDQDFALCYVCHAEEPMVDGSGDVRYDTNFNWHGYHLNNLGFKGSGGVDIDTSGAGQGNATCAECHFRTHGTALATGGQEPEKGLVNFSPNVGPLNGTLSFVPATSSTLGTCTLTCHGRPHAGYVYLAAP